MHWQDFTKAFNVVVNASVHVALTDCHNKLTNIDLIVYGIYIYIPQSKVS